MLLKHLSYNPSTSDIDMINLLTFIVETYDNQEIGHHFTYDYPFYILDLTYHDIAGALGYLTLDQKVIQEINMTLDNLQKLQATVYYNDDTDRFADKSPFVVKYINSAAQKYTGDRDFNKRFSIVLNTTLIKVFREDKGLFKKLYAHARYGLKGKYAILLYDQLFRANKGSFKVNKEYSIDEFIQIFDYELEESTNFDSWTKINSNVLSRAAKEINQKTPMEVNYDKVKESVDERKQTTGIMFTFSVAPESEDTPEYFTYDYLMKNKIAYYVEREVDKKYNVNKNLKAKSIIENKENYKYALRQSLMKKSDEFEAKIKLQEWINGIKYSFPGEHGLVCFEEYEQYEKVVVDNNHMLQDLSTGQIISNNARDTYARLKKFNNDDGQYDLIGIDITNRKNLSISYSKG